MSTEYPGKKHSPFRVMLDTDWFPIDARECWAKAPKYKKVRRSGKFEDPTEKYFKYFPFKKNIHLKYYITFTEESYYFIGEGQVGHFEFNTGIPGTIQKLANNTFKIKGLRYKDVEQIIGSKYMSSVSAVGFDTIIASATATFELLKVPMLKGKIPDGLVDYLFKIQDIWNILGGISEIYSSVKLLWRYNPRRGEYELGIASKEAYQEETVSSALISVNEYETVIVSVKTTDSRYLIDLETVGHSTISYSAKRVKSLLPFMSEVVPEYVVHPYYDGSISFRKLIEVVS